MEYIITQDMKPKDLYLIFFRVRGTSSGIDYVRADSYEEAHQITMEHYESNSITDINGIVRYADVVDDMNQRTRDHIDDRCNPESECYQKPLPEER